MPFFSASARVLMWPYIEYYSCQHTTTVISRAAETGVSSRPIPRATHKDDSNLGSHVVGFECFFGFQCSE